jgi:hypothetical protein
MRGCHIGIATRTALHVYVPQSQLFPSEEPMSSKDKEPKKTVRRDSEDGRFVTKRYAETHPKSTETERVRVKPPSPPRKPSR